MRFEIDDSSVKFIYDIENILDTLPDGAKIQQPLSAIISHDELFKQYP